MASVDNVAVAAALAVVGKPAELGTAGVPGVDAWNDGVASCWTQCPAAHSLSEHEAVPDVGLLASPEIESSRTRMGLDRIQDRNGNQVAVSTKIQTWVGSSPHR